MQALINIFIVTFLVGAWCWRAEAGTLAHALVRPIRRLVDWLGLGQDWSMFTPDPALSSDDLQVIVKRRSGAAIVWAPPRMDALSWWDAFRSFRYRGFANGLLSNRDGDARPALAEFLLRKYELGDDPAVAIVFTVVERPVPGFDEPSPSDPPAPSAFYTFVVPGDDA